jgi:hypothetical protein
MPFDPAVVGCGIADRIPLSTMEKSKIKIDTAMLDADKIREWRRKIFDLPMPGIQSQATTAPSVNTAHAESARRLDVSPKQESEAARYREMAAVTPPKHHRVKQHNDWVAARDGMRLLQIEEAMRNESPATYTYRELQTEAAKIVEGHVNQE